MSLENHEHIVLNMKSVATSGHGSTNESHHCDAHNNVKKPKEHNDCTSCLSGHIADDDLIDVNKIRL